MQQPNPSAQAALREIEVDAYPDLFVDALLLEARIMFLLGQASCQTSIGSSTGTGADASLCARGIQRPGTAWIVELVRWR